MEDVDDYAPCTICGGPTRLLQVKAHLPVRHPECHEEWMKELLAGPGRPATGFFIQQMLAAEEKIKLWEVEHADIRNRED